MYPVLPTARDVFCSYCYQNEKKMRIDMEIKTKNYSLKVFQIMSELLCNMVQKDLISTTYEVGFLSFSPFYFALFEKVKKQMRFDGICLPSIIKQHFIITKNP